MIDINGVEFLSKDQNRHHPRGATRTRRLVIDHFSGRPACYVRGLVCDRCNSVTSCHDGNKRWGPRSLPWREKAVEYAANSWQTPEEGLRLQEFRGPIDRL